MRRHGSALVMLFALAACASVARAQPAREALESLRKQVLSDRRALVAEHLELAEGEAEAFWALYDEYQEALGLLRRRRLNLLLDYAEARPSLSDQTAAALIAEHLAIRKELAVLEESFLPRFAELLPGRRLARYFQLESKIDAIINYELAAGVPLVD